VQISGTGSLARCVIGRVATIRPQLEHKPT
jgi:hypothetical protein